MRHTVILATSHFLAAFCFLEVFLKLLTTLPIVNCRSLKLKFRIAHI